MKKTTGLLPFIIASMLCCACTGTSNKSQSQQEPLQSQTKKESVPNEKPIDAKFLITNTSVGLFQIGSSWQSIAKNEYNYQYVEGYGLCMDACCDGGFDLGNKIVEGKYRQQIEKIEINIGAALFDSNEMLDPKIKNKHKNNPDVFYVFSDNCAGWYWRDKISYLRVFSDSFKIKEGVGAGTTLETAQEKLGKLTIELGWIEENPDAIQLKIDDYPNISFIIDTDDYAGSWEELSNISVEGKTLTIADFKKNTKIKRLMIRLEEDPF